MQNKAPVFNRTNMKQIYANVAAVISTPGEVLLEFGMRDVDNLNQVDVLQRIVISSAHAIRLRDALAKNLEEHAAKLKSQEEGGCT